MKKRVVQGLFWLASGLLSVSAVLHVADRPGSLGCAALAAICAAAIFVRVGSDQDR